MRTIGEIKRELESNTGRSAWSRGVCEYAKELFADYADGRHLKDSDSVEKLTDADLLNGARDWDEYSYGGCSLIYDGDICERLCPPSTQRKLSHGARQPSSSDSWLDWQAMALNQAARIVRRAANRRD